MLQKRSEWLRRWNTREASVVTQDGKPHLLWFDPARETGRLSRTAPQRVLLEPTVELRHLEGQLEVRTAGRILRFRASAPQLLLELAAAVEAARPSAHSSVVSSAVAAPEVAPAATHDGAAATTLWLLERLLQRRAALPPLPVLPHDRRRPSGERGLSLAALEGRRSPHSERRWATATRARSSRSATWGCC